VAPVWLISATPNIKIRLSIRAYSLISPLSSLQNVLAITGRIALGLIMFDKVNTLGPQHRIIGGRHTAARLTVTSVLTYAAPSLRDLLP
jgi:hypothetical protein